jgi:spore germination cell wall hydrolase CwlJ-like protein
MTDNQKLAIVGAGVLAAIGLLVANILVLSRIGDIDHKLDKTEDSIEEIKQEIDVLKEVVFDSGQRVNITQRERECLTKNIFHEAGVEPFEGKIAVAQVTFNRLNSGRWGNDICSVVYAKKQFSWTLSQKKVNENPKGKLWRDSVAAKDAFLSGLRVKNLEKSKHYHTDYIKKPYWSKEKSVAARVGQHIFYEN